MKYLILLLFLGLVSFGCDATPDEALVDDAGGVPVDGGDPLPDGPRSPCESQDLAAQCPPGSNPFVVTEGCIEGAEIIDESGSTTGVCARAGECLFACNFQDPCPCGIDALTREGIECTPCSEASACGDAVCDRGENPQSCAVDCGEICVADNERCSGNTRQECDENGRWSTLACRDDQVCQFGQAVGAVVTVCQTRISQGGAPFPGFGQSGVPVTGDSTTIRFRERSLRVPGLRFVEDGERVLGFEGGRLVIIDPAGRLPDEPTNIVVDRSVALSATRAARAGRWPQLSEFFEDTGRNVEAMVHDGAQAMVGALGLSGDDRWLGAGFAVGLEGGPREPVLGLWRTEDGRLDRLLRFVDAAVVPSQAPATAVALSLNGAVALEARPGGVIIVWNVEERRFSHLLQTEVGEVTHLVPSTAGDDLLLVGGDSALELWALAGEPRRLWRRPGGALAGLALSPDSRAVAVGDQGGTKLLDARDAQELFPLATTGALDFDPRGGRLLVGSVIYTFAL